MRFFPFDCAHFEILRAGRTGVEKSNIKMKSAKIQCKNQNWIPAFAGMSTPRQAWGLTDIDATKGIALFISKERGGNIGRPHLAGAKETLDNAGRENTF
jgi:hypothetical protein